MIRIIKKEMSGGVGELSDGIIHTIDDEDLCMYDKKE